MTSGCKDCCGRDCVDRPRRLLATVRIALPEKSDADLDALMKTWKADKSYDPRKDK
jgi:hypothetical protein